MSDDDDYLWDKSGKPDPEIERLEGVLSELKYQPPKVARVAPPAPAAPESIRTRRARAWYGYALAASFLLAIGMSTWLLVRDPKKPQPVASTTSTTTSPVPSSTLSFEVARLDGAPRIDQKAIGDKARLGVGTWLETDALSRAKITVADIGHVDVDPGTRIRLAETGTAKHQLDLDHGTIRAKVNAPPRLFVIGTEAASAVDLGCAYTLSVDEKTGEGTLKVTSGWVSLETAKRASMVPRGASCVTRKGVGPGTPYFDDAPEGLREALRRFDFEPDGKREIPAILAAARKRDSLTLWHMLSRVEGEDRKVVYKRLAELAPLPSTLDENKVLALDKNTLDLWKDELEAHW